MAAASVDSATLAGLLRAIREAVLQLNNCNKQDLSIQMIAFGFSANSLTWMLQHNDSVLNGKT